MKDGRRQGAGLSNWINRASTPKTSSKFVGPNDKCVISSNLSLLRKEEKGGKWGIHKFFILGIEALAAQLAWVGSEGNGKGRTSS